MNNEERILQMLQQHGERLAALETGQKYINAQLEELKTLVLRNGKAINGKTLTTSGVIGAIIAGLAAAGKVLGWW